MFSKIQAQGQPLLGHASFVAGERARELMDQSGPPEYLLRWGMGSISVGKMYNVGTGDSQVLTGYITFL